MAKYSNFARSRPLSPQVLAELGALEGLAPPAEPLDPTGAWEQSFRLWAVTSGKARANVGFVHIRREPAADGRTVRFFVEKALALFAGPAYRTSAEIECSADALATLRRWRVQAEVLPAEGQGEPLRVCETAELSAGCLRATRNGLTTVLAVPEPATCDWVLFDVVQRLPGQATKPLRFAMLEELDMLKPEQRLAFRGTGQITLGERTVRCLRYEQIGRGILPYQYWVDEGHRLLLAFSHTRAYINDPKVRERWPELRRAVAER